MKTTTTYKRRKRYRINKFKFIRGIICLLVLILLIGWLVISFVSTIYNMVINHDTTATVEDIGYVEVYDVINLSTDVKADSYDEDYKYDVIDYSKKPEGLSSEYYDIIVSISNEEKIPLEVILGIITTENETYDVNSKCYNDNGTVDMGLCQINSAYVDYFADTYEINNLDPYDVKDAVTFVARHMNYLSEYGQNHYDLSKEDSYIFAAGAYNRGLGNECKYRNMYYYKERFINNCSKFI